MTSNPLQEHADAVAATFNRVLGKAHHAPMSVEKVAMLHIAKELLAEFEARASDVGILTNLEAVKQRIRGLENVCRVGGLYEAFANLSRAERRRLSKQMEA